jgi:hypothetical protein
VPGNTEPEHSPEGPHDREQRTNHDRAERDRPDDSFIAAMLKEHAEARAYLQGFDDHADVIDQPVEHGPDDVVIHDRGQRRWTVTRATTGFVVIVQSRGAPVAGGAGWLLH